MDDVTGFFLLLLALALVFVIKKRRGGPKMQIKHSSLPEFKDKKRN